MSGGILDYLKCWLNGRWYEPPMSLDGLAKSSRASVFLQSRLNFKRKHAGSHFHSSKAAHTANVQQFALDFL